MNRTRIIIVDGIEIHTSLSATEIADLEQKNKELINKIKFNEKSRRKMQQSLMKQINDLEQQCKKQKEVIDKIYELINQHIRKDEFLELNEWQTRDLLIKENQKLKQKYENAVADPMQTVLLFIKTS